MTHSALAFTHAFNNKINGPFNFDGAWYWFDWGAVMIQGPYKYEATAGAAYRTAKRLFNTVDHS